MIGHKQPLSAKMLGHKMPLGVGMLGHRRPLLGGMAVATMTRELAQEKKAGGLERAKRNSGWNQGGQYAG